jgi:ParB family chromosome partitioning protein
MASSKKKPAPPAHKRPKPNALGKGLSALMGNASIQMAVPGQAYPAGGNNAAASAVYSDSFQEIALDQIEPNPWQPRTQFEEDALNDLAQSIREMGVLQAITVRKTDDGRYQIISGERRYRAAQIARIGTIPAYIREVDDRDAQIGALVENIQRVDLNPIDIATAYQSLMDEYELTQDEISDRVGKKRATVANYLRLLKLPDEIQYEVREETIAMGHAKALMGIEDISVQKNIAKKIIAQHLSVRQVEELVKALLQPKQPIEKTQDEITFDETTMDLLATLQEAFDKHFKSKASIKHNAAGGVKLTIDLKNNEDIEYVIDQLAQLD